MELYDANELFVCISGTTYKDSLYIHMNKDEVIITKQNVDDTYTYFNVFSNKKYTIFSNKNDAGEPVIQNPISLTTFISKKCDANKKLKNLTIVKKIMNGEQLNKNELKKLLFALNSNNLYRSLASINNENINIKKPNIKLNYVTILSNKKYKLEPTIGRKFEIKEILTSLAFNNKATLLVGERGIGKTNCIEEISYKLSINDIPNFLRNKKIIELNFNILNIDIESIEENIINIIEMAKKDNLIIFIDGLENINNPNILKILKYEIEKNNLKIIATINSENDKKLYNDDIFYRIIISEPSEEDLTLIISKILNDYNKNTNIKLGKGTNENLTKILINLTKKENRIISETSNKPINYDLQNPGLVAQIIDRIFAHAIINNNKELKIEDVIYGINSCNKIKEDIKKKTITYISSYFIDNEIPMLRYTNGKLIL